jgi:hypothetical protein
VDPAKYAAAHLDLRLMLLNRALRTAVERQRLEAAQLDRPDLTDRCITDRQAALLLSRAERYGAAAPAEAGPARLTGREVAAENDLRALAAGPLPLDALSEHFGLSELERQALIAVAAAELDRSYERLYAFVCDEFDRRYPSVELLLALTDGLDERHRQRVALGPFGPLRRHRLLIAPGAAPTDLRQELRLAPGVLDLLLGAPIEVAALDGDPTRVPAPLSGELVPRASELPPPAPSGWDTSQLPPGAPEPAVVQRLEAALRSGVADAIGLWSPRAGLAEATALRIVQTAGGAPRRAVPDRTGEAVREALVAAAGAPIWIPLDLDDHEAAEALTHLLAVTRSPAVITTAAPWRPTTVLARRRWIEAEAGPGQHPDLAFAAERAAVTAAAVAHRPISDDDRRRARAALTAPRNDRIVHTVTPHRRSEDLILAAGVHEQVIEIAGFARAAPALRARWRDNRLLGGVHGVKALFTGDPGTGKTLAAEVIAGLLGVHLVKVDLARVVSKWVGETSQRLEEVFATVDGTGAVLFFDEADALFGKRGEVRHGTDRYANTEVSHLLQRLEEYAGLVVLATNLRENVDPAFTRRFHAVVNFPRPAEPERRRLWAAALPTDARDPDVDLDAVAGLELTGAGIVGAVRTAGLLAGAEAVGMSHLLAGLSRQFRAEGRLFAPAVLETQMGLGT